jgi:cell pole-organizing protein PopZ
LQNLQKEPEKKPMVAQQAEMDEIISSIRTTLAEETAKVGAAQAAADSDVVELTAEEMVAVPATNGNTPHTDDLIDIAAFAQTGESQKAVASAPPAVEVPAPAAQPKVEAAAPQSQSADEFDKLLAQISDDQQKQVAVAEQQKQELMAEEPFGEADPETPNALPMAQGVPSIALNAGGGNQVALPVEVLALALQPMVQEWLKANLAQVVEKLVKDEISKLTQA